MFGDDLYLRICVEIQYNKNSLSKRYWRIFIEIDCIKETVTACRMYDDFLSAFADNAYEIVFGSGALIGKHAVGGYAAAAWRLLCAVGAG